MNQVWVSSKLLFQLFLTQKVRNESRTENGQVKKGSRLESILPSMAPLLLQKNLDQSRPVNKSTVRRFCAMCKAELEKVRKEKRPTAPNLNVLPKGRPLLLGSLDQMVQKFLLALLSIGGLITSVIAVSVAKALIARNPHLMLDHIDLDSSSWAKSFFRRMGFKKCMKTTGKIEIPNGERKRTNFCIYTILYLWLTTIMFLIV